MLLTSTGHTNPHECRCREPTNVHAPESGQRIIRDIENGPLLSKSSANRGWIAAGNVTRKGASLRKIPIHTECTPLVGSRADVPTVSRVEDASIVMSLRLFLFNFLYLDSSVWMGCGDRCGDDSCGMHRLFSLTTSNIVQVLESTFLQFFLFVTKQKKRWLKSIFHPSKRHFSSTMS